MKITNFQGDLTNNSAKKEPLEIARALTVSVSLLSELYKTISLQLVGKAPIS